VPEEGSVHLDEAGDLVLEARPPRGPARVAPLGREQLGGQLLKHRVGDRGEEQTKRGALLGERWFAADDQADLIAFLADEHPDQGINACHPRSSAAFTSAYGHTAATIPSDEDR
jgi:hypothetical protein